jgi:hypothetical protein
MILVSPDQQQTAAVRAGIQEAVGLKPMPASDALVLKL